MDWTTLTLVIPATRWLKKLLDANALEQRALKLQKDVVKRAAELDELEKLKKHNIEHLPDLILLQVERVDYRLGQVTQIADIQFNIANRSIFDVTLHKFVANPHFQGHKLAKVQDIEERVVKKQSETNFTVTYDLPQSTVKLIESLEQTKSRIQWGFEMHGYFRSEIIDFDKSQTNSITI